MDSTKTQPGSTVPKRAGWVLAYAAEIGAVLLGAAAAKGESSV